MGFILENLQWFLLVVIVLSIILLLFPKNETKKTKYLTAITIFLTILIFISNMDSSNKDLSVKQNISLSNNNIADSTEKLAEINEKYSKLESRFNEEILNLQKALTKPFVFVDYELKSDNDKFGKLLIYNEDKKAKKLHLRISSYLIVNIEDMLTIKENTNISLPYKINNETTLNINSIFLMPMNYDSYLTNETFNLDLNIFNKYYELIYKSFSNISKNLTKNDRYKMVNFGGKVDLFSMLKVEINYKDIYYKDNNITKYICMGSLKNEEFINKIISKKNNIFIDERYVKNNHKLNIKNEVSSYDTSYNFKNNIKPYIDENIFKSNFTFYEKNFSIKNFIYNGSIAIDLNEKDYDNFNKDYFKFYDSKVCEVYNSEMFHGYKPQVKYKLNYKK